MKNKYMKIVEIKTYKFDELSKESQDVAIEHFRQWIGEVDDSGQFVIEMWEEELAEKGFEDAKIYYSGFWSQGDGACFDADVNWKQFIKFYKLEEKYKELMEYAKEYEMTFSIHSTGFSNHYSHSKTRYVELENIEPDYGMDNKETAKSKEMEILAQNLEGEIEATRYELSEELYKELEAAYEETQTDEYVIDGIKANDYDFTEDGKVFKN